MHTNPHSVLTDMFTPAAAVAAGAAVEVAFTGDPVADFDICDSGPCLFDISHVFVADGHGYLYGLLCPVIPFVYVKVSAADCRFFDLYYDIIVVWFRDGYFLHP